jgi:hypothetical protein
LLRSVLRGGDAAHGLHVQKARAVLAASLVTTTTDSDGLMRPCRLWKEVVEFRTERPTKTLIDALIDIGLRYGF